MSDPYDWNPPDLAPEDMTDSDWLRSHARANFITEDIERADRIASQLDKLADLALQYEQRVRERDEAIERARQLQYAIEDMRTSR